MARLSPDDFYIVTGTGFATHDFDWISRSIPAGLDARLIDVTSSNAVLAVMGPRVARRAPAVDRARPFERRLSFRQGDAHPVAGAPVLALRVTYVGELGWELHMPVEFALTVYDALMAAGAEARPRQCRLSRDRVAASGERLPRLGRRYRARPLAPRRRPRLGGEAEIEHAISRTRPRSSAGRKPLPRLLAGFTADPSIVLLGRETIYRDGKRVGWLTSGGFGYTVGRSIGYGYVRDPETASRATYCFPAVTSSKSPRHASGRTLPRSALRPHNVAHQELSPILRRKFLQLAPGSLLSAVLTVLGFSILLRSVLLFPRTSRLFSQKAAPPTARTWLT